MVNKMENILYLRNFASEVNPNSYNLQEIGLGKAFVSKGYNCDVVYYTTQKKKRCEEIFKTDDKKLTLIWMNGYKVLSNSIYFKVLSRKFLNKYDLIITTEYNQFMTPLLCLLAPEKTVLYHGPYQESGNQLVRSLYDIFFKPILLKRLKHSFVKSELARDYLAKKGLNNIKTIGVGLDQLNLIQDKQMNFDIKDKLLTLNGKKVLLYIGKLEERRNITLLLKIFKKIIDVNNGFSLLIVGDGETRDTSRYWDYIYNNNLQNHIVYFSKVKQNELWQIYSTSDLMIFPTTYDIFGMVLLESMFFQVPVISSVNGGAITLIENNVNGFIVDSVDENVWSNKIMEIFEHPQLLESVKKESKKQVEIHSWDCIADIILMSVDDERKEGVIVEESTVYS